MRKEIDVIGALQLKLCKANAFIYVDKDALIKVFEDEKWHFEEGSYVGTYSIPGDGALSKEMYYKNCQDMVDTITAMDDEFFKNVVHNWPRKKDGHFNRRNVQYLAESNNSVYISDWHNTWIYYTVKVVATGDDTLEVMAYRKTDTLG